MSQHYPSLPGCAVSLPTGAITALTLLGSCVLSPSVTSVKNVHAVQREQSITHHGDLPRSLTRTLAALLRGGDGRVLPKEAKTRFYERALSQAMWLYHFTGHLSPPSSDAGGCPETITPTATL